MQLRDFRITCPTYDDSCNKYHEAKNAVSETFVCPPDGKKENFDWFYATDKRNFSIDSIFFCN